MSDPLNFLAFDLGASSGRAMLARFDGRAFTLTELQRFDNGPVQSPEGLFWDAPRLFDALRAALRACRTASIQLAGVGIDTWGVDFALLDGDGRLLAPPRHYRDPRNLPAMQAALERLGRARIYAATGIQFMPFNTVFQLCAEAAAPHGVLPAARRLLFMPDLLTYWLTGTQQTEPTIASTSQALTASTRDWDHALLAELGLPAQIFPTIRPTGTLAGPLCAPALDDLGQPAVPVVLTASHDTASAVAAVPTTGDDWAYISSGTWSLVGVELPAPLISPATQAANFTNEAGFAGTTRFLKNVAGLWLLQECRRCWRDAGHAWSFDELHAMAAAAPPWQALIDPDDPRFAPPGDMPARIVAACEERGQPVPPTPAALVRCILDSLALRYAEVLESAAALTGRTLRTVHVVGGGSRNHLLNELIAGATGRRVVTGPVEATALGNAAVQAIAVGALPDLAAARRAIAASVDLRTYEPPADATTQRAWATARRRFGTVTGACSRGAARSAMKRRA
jgi:rhamnulokinase